MLDEFHMEVTLLGMNSNCHKRLSITLKCFLKEARWIHIT